ncbi:efflux RND transporter periplasmic adaptor subunit [Aeoliella sp.]|uniref:efflux RND transporter periplasmic adaptor subunit n=1 Tax=Aeoliella sp. TaxID=2795800 RepID=UPI003CCBD15A
MMKSLSIALPVVLVAGVATGLLVRPALEGLLATPEEDPHVHETASAEPDHLPLSFEAVQNLGLQAEPVTLSDFVVVRRMPGEIIEAPGLSSQKIAAPVSGKIARLFAAPGMSIQPGDPLLELEIIDDELMQAQLQLLELQTKHEINSAELKRLGPLADSGGIAGRKLLDLEYDLKQIKASLSRTRQELAMRGLSDEQIAKIENSGQAIKRLRISVPPLGAIEGEDSSASLAELAKVKDSLALETLLVEVGQNVTRGEGLASLEVHGLLMVCGHAFESDVDLVSKIATSGEEISIEFGVTDEGKVEPGFRIQHVAGHVDEVTQTYHYFIPLENEVVRESKNALGQVFRTWRYKVGQRVHTLIPAERLAGQIVLPRDAVVQDGPEYYVFREIPFDVLEAEHGVYMEMERVPVKVVSRDTNLVAIDPSGQLKPGDRVAMGSAYKLLLAFKAQQEGGGSGHDHHHH